MRLITLVGRSRWSLFDHDHGVLEQVDDGDGDNGQSDKVHPEQVDDCRSVRAGQVKAESKRVHFQNGFHNILTNSFVSSFCCCVLL